MTNPMIEKISKLLFLPILVVALAVLVKGYSAVGDGFSAGMIASLGVILQYMAFGYDKTEEMLPLFRFAPWLSVPGLLMALGLAFLPVLFGQPILTHFPRPGEEVFHFGRLEFHTALWFDLGVFLLVFGFAITTIRLIFQVREQELA